MKRKTKKQKQEEKNLLLLMKALNPKMYEAVTKRPKEVKKDKDNFLEGV